MRGNETPGRIVTNFCTGLWVHDIITSANFYDCRLRGLSVVGGQILGFSIDSRRRPYNTLALPYKCVIMTLRFLVSLGVSPQRGEKMPVPICTIVQNFIPIGVTVAEISVTVQKTYLKLNIRQNAYMYTTSCTSLSWCSDWSYNTKKREKCKCI